MTPQIFIIVRNEPLAALDQAGGTTSVSTAFEAGANALILRLFSQIGIFAYSV